MFAFFQIIHALPKQWKEVLTNNTDTIDNLVFYDHHLANKHQMYCLSKLGSNILYEILICNNSIKPSSQFYYEQLFPEIDTDHWINIYLLPQKVTLDSTLQNFQYKILNNVLYLNKMLHKFKKIESPLCSHCNMESKTP